MKIFLIYFGILIGILVVGLGITWAAQGVDFFMYQFWAPKYAHVQRQVFENTPSYVKGTVQNLENEETAYLSTSDPKAKEALRSIILHDCSGFNMDDPDVTQDLRTFVNSIK